MRNSEFFDGKAAVLDMVVSKLATCLICRVRRFCLVFSLFAYGDFDGTFKGSYGHPTLLQSEKLAVIFGSK